MYRSAGFVRWLKYQRDVLGLQWIPKDLMTSKLDEGLKDEISSSKTLEVKKEQIKVEFIPEPEWDEEAYEVFQRIIKALKLEEGQYQLRNPQNGITPSGISPSAHTGESRNFSSAEDGAGSFDTSKEAHQVFPGSSIQVDFRGPAFHNPEKSVWGLHGPLAFKNRPELKKETWKHLQDVQKKFLEALRE